MSTTDDYVRRATVVRVIDGDTVVVDVDLGFYLTARMSCRLAGINARELRAPGGPQARSRLATLLPVGTTITLKSIKPDKYAGRFDGVIWTGEVNINDAMVDDGYAVPWDGTGPAPVPPWFG